VEGLGYLASLLVFSTFYMKTMLPLRGVAIASNIAFMAYGLTGGIGNSSGKFGKPRVARCRRSG
jgi:hypothetical protein